MHGSPSQGDRSLRKATDPYEPTIVHITLLVDVGLIQNLKDRKDPETKPGGPPRGGAREKRPGKRPNAA